jgi:hypothetical protein
MNLLTLLAEFYSVSVVPADVELVIGQALMMADE